MTTSFLRFASKWRTFRKLIVPTVHGALALITMAHQNFVVNSKLTIIIAPANILAHFMKRRRRRRRRKSNVHIARKRIVAMNMAYNRVNMKR